MTLAPAKAPSPGPAGPDRLETRQTVLIFVQIATHFAEMLRVADLLRASDRYRPVLLFMTDYTGSAGHREMCRARGVTYVSPTDFHRYVPADREPRRLLRLPAARAWATVRRSVVRTTVRARRGFTSMLRRAVAGAGLVGRRVVPVPATRALEHAWAPVRRAIRRVSMLVDPVGYLVVGAAIALVELVSRGLAWVGRRGQALGSVSRKAVTRGARGILTTRVPTVRELMQAGRIPRPIGAAAAVLLSALSMIAWPILVVLRPPLRRSALFAFGLLYARRPAWLPPDVRAQRHVLRLAPTLARAFDVRLLVIPEDNFYYFTNVFVRAVQQRGGHAVVVPFTIVNTLEWAEAFYRLPSYDLRRTVNFVTSFLFPRWVHRHKGVSVIMPPQQVLSNESLGIAPSLPWLINSGHADALAAESRFMEQYYLAAGIQPDRLRLTGSLSDDVLFRQLAAAAETRRRLYAELGLAADRPMILCALPPNQLEGDGRPECEFQDYRSVLHAFLEPLEALADDYNVILALHPRTTKSEAAAIEGLRARQSTRNIAELIPLCQIFVACCSATIRQAISCGIPVVNYDVFVYDYDDYKKVPGVATISGHAGYREVLTRLARSPEQYAHARHVQIEFAGQHTTLDGRAGDRLLSLFDELTASPDVRPGR